jgi:hypothetical protein
MAERGVTPMMTPCAIGAGYLESRMQTTPVSTTLATGSAGRGDFPLAGPAGRNMVTSSHGARETSVPMDAGRPVRGRIMFMS